MLIIGPLLASKLGLLLDEEVVNVLLFEIQEHLGNCFNKLTLVEDNKFVDLIKLVVNVNLDELAIELDNLGIDIVVKDESKDL